MPMAGLNENNFWVSHYSVETSGDRNCTLFRNITFNAWKAVIETKLFKKLDLRFVFQIQWLYWQTALTVALVRLIVVKMTIGGGCQHVGKQNIFSLFCHLRLCFPLDSGVCVLSELDIWKSNIEPSKGGLAALPFLYLCNGTRRPRHRREESNLIDECKCRPRSSCGEAAWS